MPFNLFPFKLIFILAHGGNYSSKNLLFLIKTSLGEWPENRGKLIISSIVFQKIEQFSLRKVGSSSLLVYYESKKSDTYSVHSMVRQMVKKRIIEKSREVLPHTFKNFNINPWRSFYPLFCWYYREWCAIILLYFIYQERIHRARYWLKISQMLFAPRFSR